MKNKKYIEVGKISSAHGLKGEVVAMFSETPSKEILNLKNIFTQNNAQSFLPWFITSIKQKRDNLFYVSFDEISTREKAQPLLQQRIFIAENNFEKYFELSSTKNLLNFTIVENNKTLGVVESIYEQAGQMIATIHIENTEVLIPLNEETLKKILPSKKEIIVELPEGLLQIYLNK